MNKFKLVLSLLQYNVYTLNLMHTIKEFLTFLSDPRIDSGDEDTLNIVSATYLFFIVLFTGFIIYAPLMVFIGTEDLSHKVEDLLESLSKIQIILFTVILAPIIEEILFRYPLKYPKLILIFLFLSLFALVHSFLGLSPNYFCVLTSFIIIAIATVLLQFKIISAYWHKLVNENYGYFFYWTVIIFAFLHGSNFDMPDNNWYFIPILVMPQFTLALLLGYVRVKKHLGYSIYLHSLNNLIPVIAWMSMQ